MQSSETIDLAVGFALDKKGFDLKLFDVRELSSLTDFILIVSGRSDRQVQAIAEQYPDVTATVGVHPLDVDAGTASIEQLCGWAKAPKTRPSPRPRPGG